jgi:hypothetical protein
MAIKRLLFQTIMNNLRIRQMLTRKDFKMSFRKKRYNGLIYLHACKDLIKNIIHSFSSNLNKHPKLKRNIIFLFHVPSNTFSHRPGVLCNLQHNAVK